MVDKVGQQLWAELKGVDPSELSEEEVTTENPAEAATRKLAKKLREQGVPFADDVARHRVSRAISKENAEQERIRDREYDMARHRAEAERTSTESLRKLHRQSAGYQVDDSDGDDE
ncbi:hypothetical protein ACFYQA_05655 [Streptomyces sp. NPDC005774]|uniref:hypothetical protein n=1 Tax=Streptomyces sp. NPDC005774 TaxID=3364728 RepID=UPI00368E125B